MEQFKPLSWCRWIDDEDDNQTYIYNMYYIIYIYTYHIYTYGCPYDELCSEKCIEQMLFSWFWLNITARTHTKHDSMLFHSFLGSSKYLMSSPWTHPASALGRSVRSGKEKRHSKFTSQRAFVWNAPITAVWPRTVHQPGFGGLGGLAERK